MGRRMRDPRFVGHLDAPPDGMLRMGVAMGCSIYDICTNRKSIFAPDFRWALVARHPERPKKEK